MSNTSRKTETVTLYEEYRLIEKDESEINVAWRGVHLLLFFLAFVFGSFCTFCFHLLMYLFDDKCVLFPKLISLKESRKPSGSGTIGISTGTGNKLLYDYISDDLETLPIDFVSTNWVEKSMCYLPTYAPLLSGICGLIWTTMFLMCSSGSRALTGLQRPWRILPTVFVFSLAMGGLSIYTSLITQAGLEELCNKLGEISGSNSCSHTINVATLAYERRIRGVYQATKLTVMSAWLHTCCWLGAALAALVRIILVVDFRLVKVRVDLQGNIEKMLERHERHIRTDEYSNKDDYNSLRQASTNSLKVRFVNKGFGTEPPKSDVEQNIQDHSKHEIQFLSQNIPFTSEMSLVPDENRKLALKSGSSSIAKKHRFIIEMLHEIVDSIGTEPSPVRSPQLTKSDVRLARQLGVPNLKSIIWSPSSSSETDESVMNRQEAEEVARKFRHQLEHKLQTRNFQVVTPLTLTPASSTNIKSSLKNRGVQTDEIKKTTASQRVQITSPTGSQITLHTLKPHEEHAWKSSIDASTLTVVTSDIKPEKLIPDATEVYKLESEKKIHDEDKKPLPVDGKVLLSVDKTLLPDDGKNQPPGEKAKSLPELSEKPVKRFQISSFLSSLIDTGDTIAIRPSLQVQHEKEKKDDTSGQEQEKETVEVKKTHDGKNTGKRPRSSGSKYEYQEPNVLRVEMEENKEEKASRELEQKEETRQQPDLKAGTAPIEAEKDQTKRQSGSKDEDQEPGPSRTEEEADLHKKKTLKKPKEKQD